MFGWWLTCPNFYQKFPISNVLLSHFTPKEFRFILQLQLISEAIQSIEARCLPKCCRAQKLSRRASRMKTSIISSWKRSTSSKKIASRFIKFLLSLISTSTLNFFPPWLQIEIFYFADRTRPCHGASTHRQCHRKSSGLCPAFCLRNRNEAHCKSLAQKCH